MILFNFDFFKTELTKNAMEYLKDEYKNELLKEGDQWNFNGKGFKNKSSLIKYIYEKKRIPENYFNVEKVTSPSYRINEGTIQLLYELFVRETPLYINRERLYKFMLLSSNLMFIPNAKISFTIMFEDPYKQWTAQEIVDKVKKYHFQEELKVEKIEESFERYLQSTGKSDALVSCEKIEGVNKYKIHFTNFIYYLRHFDSEL